MRNRQWHACRQPGANQDSPVTPTSIEQIFHQIKLFSLENKEWIFVPVTSTNINATTPSSMILASFQVALQAVVTRTAPLANRGPDTVSGDTLGRSYCWSHGYTQNVDHNSMTYRNKKTGHCDVSTGTNRMNGKSFMYSTGRSE